MSNHGLNYNFLQLRKMPGPFCAQKQVLFFLVAQDHVKHRSSLNSSELRKASIEKVLPHGTAYYNLQFTWFCSKQLCQHPVALKTVIYRASPQEKCHTWCQAYQGNASPPQECLPVALLPHAHDCPIKQGIIFRYARAAIGIVDECGEWAIH